MLYEVKNMNAIAIVDKNWAVGREGGLLFNLPSDMKRFKELTLGGTVILGRKTMKTFHDGKPLPGRRNIIITRKVDFDLVNAESAPSPDAALEMAAGTDPDKIWVIGGGSVYAALLDRCKRVYLTRVEADAGEADTFFPNLDKLPDWEVEHAGEPITENGLTFRYIEYIHHDV